MYSQSFYAIILILYNYPVCDIRKIPKNFPKNFPNNFPKKKFLEIFPHLIKKKNKKKC